MQCIVSACIETVFQLPKVKGTPFCDFLVACVNCISRFAIIDEAFNWNDYLLAFCQYVKNYIDFTFFLVSK